VKNWFRVAFVVPPSLVEVASSTLFDWSCVGLQEEEVAGGTCLIAYFEDQSRLSQVVMASEKLVARLNLASEVQAAPVPDEDWTTSWRSYFKPVLATPRILICPPWSMEPAPPSGIVIAIDPKMAFGTGHHETTRLALCGLEMSVVGGERVLDVGTGSGILSIAALKLGAESIFAFDTDPPAVGNTKENLALNGISGGVEVVEGSFSLVSGEFDLVVANIISSILIPMLPEVTEHTKKGGRAVLGGILARERDAFCQAVTAAGFVIDNVLEEGEWICALGRKG
jgi:ribosomal protein L11 methyltransferase